MKENKQTRGVNIMLDMKDFQRLFDLSIEKQTTPKKLAEALILSGLDIMEFDVDYRMHVEVEK